MMIRSVGYDTWRCMVCEATDRPFGAISVAHRPPPPEYADVLDRINVSYCNDRPGCVTVATATGPWPAERVDAITNDSIGYHGGPLESQQ